MTILAAVQQRSSAWQALFVIGLAGLAMGLLKAWWAAPATPFVPAVVPPPAPSIMQVPPRPVAPSKIIQSLPPAPSFGTPTASPKSLPELEGLARPAPAPKMPLPEFGFQPGYVPPPGPLHLRPE